MGKRERIAAREANRQEVINMVNWHFNNAMASKLNGQGVIRMNFNEGGFTHATDEILRNNPGMVIRRDDKLRTAGEGEYHTVTPKRG